MEGIIFDIKKYAVHDGPGIRTTVFFKGCPLRCSWCHNPEGQESEPELILRPSRCLAGCRACQDVCPEGALSQKGGVLFWDRAHCPVCGLCANVCPSEAIQVAGRNVSSEEVLEEIFRDVVFHEESGGGVTFSGGEPFFQPEFLTALLDGCGKQGVDTAVDTCGYVPWETIHPLLGRVGLFLYDIKIMEEEEHRKWTGVSNSLILENLQRLVRSRAQVVVRFPVVSGVNDGEEEVERIARFLKALPSIPQVDLLPYHKLGLPKYDRLQKEGIRLGFEPPSEETLRRIEGQFRSHGIAAKRGG